MSGSDYLFGVGVVILCLLVLSYTFGWYDNLGSGRVVCRIGYDISSDDNIFDCDIIYGRLGSYWNENSGYVYGSLKHIEITACSDEVLSVVARKFDMTYNKSACSYACCLTDGNPINNQGYHSNTFC